MPTSIDKKLEYYTWGFSRYGTTAQASADDIDVDRPKRLDELFKNPIRLIACGPVNGAVVLENGEMWTWGHCGSGQ